MTEILNRAFVIYFIKFVFVFFNTTCNIIIMYNFSIKVKLKFQSLIKAFPLLTIITRISILNMSKPVT